MKKVLSVAVFIFLFSCSSKDKYDIARYYDLPEQQQILASIISYIFSAPPYVKMEDRFKPEHRMYYSSVTSKFSIKKYFIAEDGTHYFYVIRPGPKLDEKRGVGGHYRLKDGYQLTDFREVFVTPLLPEADVTGRCTFLFDEMVEGNINNYLKMETYIQWPNEISYYDSITYEWKMKPEFEAQPVN